MLPLYKTRPRSESTLCVPLFFFPAKEAAAAAAAARGLHSLSLKWCTAFFRGTFVWSWTGTRYIWLFLKEKLWCSTLLQHIWPFFSKMVEETPSGEWVCIFKAWSEALADPSRRQSYIGKYKCHLYLEATSYNLWSCTWYYEWYTCHYTLLTELCYHILFEGDLTLYITDSSKMF